MFAHWFPLSVSICTALLPCRLKSLLHIQLYIQLSRHDAPDTKKAAGSKLPAAGMREEKSTRSPAGSFHVSFRIHLDKASHGVVSIRK